MDARRHLTPATFAFMLASAVLSGCSLLSVRAGPAAAAPAPLAGAVAGPPAATTQPPSAPAAPRRAFATMAPVPNPSPDVAAARRSPATAAGPAAIAAANRQALVRSSPGAFSGGVQVFAWVPGRIYEVWTAPLRVTTLTLPAGEDLISKAAGDTVRWQIGETRSGEGPSRRVHVMVKPFTRGLSTNLVLATTRRLYFIRLRSGPSDSFNAAVVWRPPAELKPPKTGGSTPSPAATAAARPFLRHLDAGYEIRPKGRRPAWTPTAVITDGRRTYLVFPPKLAAGEAPVLFARGPGGDLQLVNYRQQGAIWIVDRVLARAELRLGRRHPRIVRIARLGDGS